MHIPGLHKHLAIVLRSVVTGERDRVVTALTENAGIMTVFAKNSVQSRRFGGSLELFTAAEWTVRVKGSHTEMPHLDEAQIKRGFEGLRKDFERLGMAGAFSEILVRLLQPGVPVPHLFRLHANALAILDERGASLPLLHLYVYRVLSWSGHAPQWHACRGCNAPLTELWQKYGNPEMPLEFRVEQAGFLCPECCEVPTHPLTIHTLIEAGAHLALPMRDAIAGWTLSSEEHRALAESQRAILRYHIPGFDRQDLKSLEWVLSLSAWETASKSSTT